MLSRLVGLSTVATVLLAFGCQKRGPRLLKDTEGRSFEASCPESGPCKFAQKAGRQRAEKPSQALMTGSRLVGICDVRADETPHSPFIADANEAATGHQRLR